MLRTRPARRRARLLPMVTLVLWAIPNTESPWWHDRAYDLCMATAGDNDWTCEERLNALPSALEAGG